MKEKFLQTSREYIVLIGTSLLRVFLVRTFVAQPFVVNGSSMEPNFHTNEYLIVDQLSYEISHPKRGEVIIFRYPVIPTRFFIKRVIALPGETIKITGTKVEIKEVGAEDFYTLEEPYIEFEKESEVVFYTYDTTTKNKTILNFAVLLIRFCAAVN